MKSGTIPIRRALISVSDKDNLNDLAKFLESLGTKNYDFRELNQYGNTILHHCIKVGDSEILKILNIFHSMSRIKKLLISLMYNIKPHF